MDIDQTKPVAADRDDRPGDQPTVPVEVYWRPGCGFCSSMRAALTEAGVPARWRNIWEDHDAAAFVRSVARGNETVPTVRVGESVMVNPRPHDVVAMVSRAAPELDIDERRWPPLRIAQWVTVAVLVVVANLLARSGQEWLAWLADAAAIASYFVFRTLRSRPRPDRGAGR